jgi:hypothetical protein
MPIWGVSPHVWHGWVPRSPIPQYGQYPDIWLSGHPIWGGYPYIWLSWTPGGWSWEPSQVPLLSYATLRGPLEVGYSTKMDVSYRYYRMEPVEVIYS